MAAAWDLRPVKPKGMFDGIPFKTFRVSELNGKTVRIYSTKDETNSFVLTCAYDEKTGECFVLAKEPIL